MPGVELTDIVKDYGAARVIDQLSLQVRDKELLVLLGPSGCGKTTLLRIIAGLESLDQGEVRIDDRRIDRLPPGERGVAMVFQHYALYPHMTIRENMAFGLRNMRVPAREIDERIAAAAHSLEMESLLDRKPGQLSGGQKQRVAIGRAIVKQPKLFLFDEPLSNLDAGLRARTRIELAQLHHRSPATMIFVTHDQVEAMTLADRIVVLNGGKIEQIGTPMEIYARPATAFVAGFVGSPAISLLPADISPGPEGKALMTLATGEAVATRIDISELAPSGHWRIGVRAEAARIADAGDLAAKVDVLERLGDRTLAYCTLKDGSAIIAEDVGASGLSIGEAVRITVDPAGVHLFDGDGRGHHG